MPRFILFLIICLTANFCFAQTQNEIIDEAANTYRKTDKKLNDLYQKIIKEYQSDTVFVRNFKHAQKLWVQLRDAEMKAKYPDRGPAYYGSIQPLCEYKYITELTNERIKNIRVWITGAEQGDACEGSVKIKRPQSNQ